MVKSPGMSNSTVDILVPVRNESAGLARFYERISQVPGEFRLVFIDNASTDNSVDIINGFPNSCMIRHERDEGYGGSIIDGIAQTTAPYIVIIDADCEYPPECVPDLVDSLEDHDIVYASRFLNKDSAAEARMPFLKMFGNRCISSLFNVLFGQHTTDLYTGCKALRRTCLEGVDLQCKGFEHVLELAARLAHRGYKIKEIPVMFEPRETGRSKMRHVSETVKFVWLVFAFFVRSRLDRL